MQDDGFDAGIWSGWGDDDPNAPIDSPAPVESLPPDGGPDVPPAEGTLQVIEPPSALGLLDTIVGDVVASFLGK